MNILLLLGANPAGDMKGISRRIHYDFLLKLKNNNIVHTYGPWEKDPLLSPLKYDKSIRFGRILRYYTPDVVIIYSMFCTHSWLPLEFDTSSIPRICIEVDYWNVTRRARNWYKKYNFNLLIQRGSYTRSVINSVWLPFSASEDFLPSNKKKIKDRLREISFIGRGGGSLGKKGYYYPIRREALRRLLEDKLVNIIGRVSPEVYPSFLSKYFCYFCDSGRFDSAPAKTFEIMASGAALFTTPFRKYRKLFNGKKVCFFYDKDLVDVKDKARELLNLSNDEIQEIVNTGVEEIKRQHLDSHRVEDLQEVLHSYLRQGNIVQKWGI